VLKEAYVLTLDGGYGKVLEIAAKTLIFDCEKFEYMALYLSKVLKEEYVLSIFVSSEYIVLKCEKLLSTVYVLKLNTGVNEDTR
jgi:hypothetical protein